MLNEILTEWTVPNCGSSTTVMYWDDSEAVNDQREAWGDFLRFFPNYFVLGTTATVATTGRTIDPATGVAGSFWAEPTAQVMQGVATSGQVANAAQALVRWNTPGVVAGRQVKGRTFLPGFSTTALAGGEIAGAVLTILDDYVDAFLASQNSLSIWSRPITGRPGTQHIVQSGSVWNELAVLRRRRA